MGQLVILAGIQSLVGKTGHSGNIEPTGHGELFLSSAILSRLQIGQSHLFIGLGVKLKACRVHWVAKQDFQRRVRERVM